MNRNNSSDPLVSCPWMSGLEIEVLVRGSVAVNQVLVLYRTENVISLQFVTLPVFVEFTPCWDHTGSLEIGIHPLRSNGMAATILRLTGISTPGGWRTVVEHKTGTIILMRANAMRQDLLWTDQEPAAGSDRTP